MRRENITTTGKETFTHAQSCALAHSIWVRFGRENNAAADAWRRLLGNNCSDHQYMQLVFEHEKPDTQALINWMIHQPEEASKSIASLVAAEGDFDVFFAELRDILSQRVREENNALYRGLAARLEDITDFLSNYKAKHGDQKKKPKAEMLITAEQKQNACDFLSEMQQMIQQPDTDDLHFIRTELSDHFAELLKQLE